MRDLEARTAVVTGSASVESLGASVLPVVTDVSDEASMDHLGDATREAFGSPHVVCLNAGVSAPTGPIRARHQSIESQTEPPARGTLLDPCMER